MPALKGRAKLMRKALSSGYGEALKVMMRDLQELGKG